MRKLPHRRLAQTGTAARSQLAAWLAEWGLDALLSTAGTATGTPAWDRGACEAESASETILAGQVRLFRPFCPATWSRPVYVAVLETAGPCHLVVPFSRFSTPATPGELRTSATAPPMRVLCLWNAAILPTATVTKSWTCAILPSPDMADAGDLWIALQRGDPPPDRLGDRLGPLLAHPDDPRRIYRNRETLWMDTVRGWGCMEARDGGNVIRIPRLSLPAPEPGLARAAEGRTVYARGTVIRLAGSPLLLRVLPARGEACGIAVEPAGKLPNTALDGFVVIARTVTARISEGQAELPVSKLKDGLALCDPEGCPVPLVSPLE